MSARVNLLPPRLAARRRARRIARTSKAAVAAVILALAGAQYLKMADVDDARGLRDAEQVQVTALQQEVAELAPYREMADRLASGNALLAHAMVDEVSWARALNDLSLAFPASASMSTLSGELIATAPTDDAATVAAGTLDEGTVTGSIVFTGYSVEELSPGVREVIAGFDDTLGFADASLAAAAAETRGDTEVTGFNGDVRLDEAARTGRYAEGLPEEDLS